MTTWRDLSPAERLAAVKAAWRPRATARDIALTLSATWHADISRNAVCSYYHRHPAALAAVPLGGTGKTGGRRAKRQGARPPARTARQRPAPSGPAGARESDEALMLSVMELTATTCRWPIGHPREAHFGFCGRRCAADRPYCDRHAAVAFRPAGKAEGE